MKRPHKINRTFNHWNKTPSTELPPTDAHYSVTRDRGTLKAETLLETLARQPKNEKGERPMLTPPPLPGRR